MSATNPTNAEAALPFSLKGETINDTIFEFPEPNATQKGSIPLRVIVRQYTGSPQSKTFPAKMIYNILGRLRCILYTLTQYNQGATALTQPQVFLQYWRKRALNLLSGFGFQVQNTKQEISIIGLNELVRAIEAVYQADIAAYRDTISRDQITFEALSELYRPDTPVQGKISLGGHFGTFMVTDSFFEEHRSLVGIEKSFHWSMDFIATMGAHFSVVNFTEVLSGWTGVRARPISELTYVPINPEQLDFFKKRGESYVNFSRGGPQFVGYRPNTFFIHSVPTTGGSFSRSMSSLLPYGGRIMLDPARGIALGHHASSGNDEPSNAMQQLAGRYKHWSNAAGGQSGSSSDSLQVWDIVPEELYLFCWPALVGFSFSAKAWGHVLVTGLEPIAFHDRAFERLVISEERKQLIRALIRFGGEQNEDLIGGKSGGTIILLHGPPGVGKTLTAEAIAEMLHRPLYYVTMGELGVQPQEMEKRLGDVLELCSGWNALALLDEADVFLETRTTNDLVRNTLVCVMLRLLEYHPGILFLTTNRVRSFDPAVESRVTVALRYESLTLEARMQIWKNLLSLISIPVSKDISFEDLAKHELNGRQIKNAVRLAVALAKERESDINPSILNSTIQITNIGRQEIKEDHSWRPEKDV